MTDMKQVLKSNTFKISVGIGISIVLLVWVLSQVDFSQTVNELKNVNLWFLIPITLILTAQYLLRALRWRLLLEKGSEIQTSTLAQSILVGTFASFILPLRAGEFIRPLFLSKYSRTSFSQAFLSVVVERFFDLSAVLITFLFVVKGIEGLPSWVRDGAMALSWMALIILGLLLVAIILPKQLVMLSEAMIKFFPQKLQEICRKIVAQLIDGAAVLGNIRRFVEVLFWTALVWLSAYVFTTATLYLLPTIDHSFELGTITTVIIALAVAAPSAPGFLGVYQTACLAAFALFHISREQALAYSLVSHAFTYLYHCGLGALILLAKGVKLSELRESSR